MVTELRSCSDGQVAVEWAVRELFGRSQQEPAFVLMLITTTIITALRSFISLLP